MIPLHEFNVSGQHRIVLVQDDGTNEAGKWVPVHEVANLRSKWFAVCGESPLPQGIFTCKQIAHQVLGHE